MAQRPSTKIPFFDLDGVFLNDILLPEDMSEETVDWDVVRSLRIRLGTLWEPKIPWGLITGRPIDDKQSTLDSLGGVFENPPCVVHHDNEDPCNPVAYKIMTLRVIRGSVSFFVESSPEEAKAIADACPWLYVLTFNDLVNTALEELL